MLVLLAGLAHGCSNQQLYEAIQNNRQQECELLPPPQDEECLAAYNESYDSYREALDEAAETQ
ncbi:MAG: hypothetical protein QNJ85_15155 [Gammaproteobacteria bacterium]|nr:hypothetical protein [Gammaproteobacteria bacterium]